jgi:hypothetical protein
VTFPPGRSRRRLPFSTVLAEQCAAAHAKAFPARAGMNRLRRSSSATPRAVPARAGMNRRRQCLSVSEEDVVEPSPHARG